jgi:hypothetical protein
VQAAAQAAVEVINQVSVILPQLTTVVVVETLVDILQLKVPPVVLVETPTAGVVTVETYLLVIELG